MRLPAHPGAGSVDRAVATGGQPTQALSILFTNNTLSLRAGSELWVRDMCRALVGRGHRPMAFSLLTGAVAEDLRAATVPVITDLDDVAVAPDLIHGHHHIETLIAALRFPGVPIVHFCHGWLPWEEAPLRHPSIARYVAVDETCRDRLTAENGIDPGQVDLLPNFVDLKRFLPRDPLPARPRRALLLNNTADDHNYGGIIREACREQGIELEIAGLRSGHTVEMPYTLLPGFDLVFAKGRAALEAMAVGCSVILTDAIGCGPLVTASEFSRMRRGNFGIRWLQQPHAIDWYRTQIAAYDAADAGRLSALVRDEAGLELAVDRLLKIYQRALADHDQRPVAGNGAVASQHAAARHLSSVAWRFKRIGEIEAAAHTISAELASVVADRERLVNERTVLCQQATDLTTALANAHASAERTMHDQAVLRQQNGELATEVASASAGRDLMTRERATLLEQMAELATELSSVQVRCDRMTLERVALLERTTELATELSKAQGDCDSMIDERAQLQQQTIELSTALANAHAEGDRTTHERAFLLDQITDLSADKSACRELNRQLTADLARFEQTVAAYRALPTLRLRDALIRLPLVGMLAQRAARWLT